MTNREEIVYYYGKCKEYAWSETARQLRDYPIDEDLIAINQEDDTMRFISVEEAKEMYLPNIRYCYRYAMDDYSNWQDWKKDTFSSRLDDPNESISSQEIQEAQRRYAEYDIEEVVNFLWINFEVVDI